MLRKLAKCEWCGTTEVKHPWSALHCKPACEKLSEAAEGKLLESMAAMLWPAGEWLHLRYEGTERDGVFKPTINSSALWTHDEAQRYRGHIVRGRQHATAKLTCANTIAGEITCST